MSIKHESEEDWKEEYHPEYLCTLNMYWQDLVESHSVRDFDHHIDGLGPHRGAVISIAGVFYWLSAYYDPNKPVGRVSEDLDPSHPSRHADRVTVYIRSYEPNQKHALSVLCAALGIEETELEDRKEHLSIANWQLLRLDDNGNEVEMFRYHDERAALYVRDKYTNKGHKQVYFVNDLSKI